MKLVWPLKRKRGQAEAQTWTTGQTESATVAFFSFFIKLYAHVNIVQWRT